MLIRKTKGTSQNPSGFKTSFIICSPTILLQDSGLTFNEKLIMSLCWTLHQKKGFTAYSFKKIAGILNMHVNSVSSAFRGLLKQGYLKKDKQKSGFVVCNPYISQYSKSRYVVIPHQVYGIRMTSGAKLLWGEYNSQKIYFAKREYTSKMLRCTKNSVSKWTKVLDDEGLLKEYTAHSGENCKQKVVRTKHFKDDVVKPVHPRNVEGESLFDDELV